MLRRPPPEIGHLSGDPSLITQVQGKHNWCFNIDGKLKNFSTKRKVLIGTIKSKRTPWVVELRGRADQKNILNGNSFPKKFSPRWCFAVTGGGWEWGSSGQWTRPSLGSGQSIQLSEITLKVVFIYLSMDHASCSNKCKVTANFTQSSVSIGINFFGLNILYSLHEWFDSRNGRLNETPWSLPLFTSGAGPPARRGGASRGPGWRGRCPGTGGCSGETRDTWYCYTWHVAMCRWTAPTGSMPGSMGSLGSCEENTVRSLEDIMRSVAEVCEEWWVDVRWLFSVAVCPLICEMWKVIPAINFLLKTTISYV